MTHVNSEPLVLPWERTWADTAEGQRVRWGIDVSMGTGHAAYGYAYRPKDIEFLIEKVDFPLVLCPILPLIVDGDTKLISNPLQLMVIASNYFARAAPPLLLRSIVEERADMARYRAGEMAQRHFPVWVRQLTKRQIHALSPQLGGSLGPIRGAKRGL